MPKPSNLLITIAVVGVVLLGIRIALPEGLQWYVNGKLDAMPTYDGEVGDIDLALLRGAYSIDDIAIVKTEGNVPVPFLEAERIEFSLLWSALFDGAVVGEALLERPRLNIVDSAEAAGRQTGTEAEWNEVLDELFPLRLDRVEIHDGELHFRNFGVDPAVDVHLSAIEATALNLTNSADLADSMVATLDLSALVMESTELTLAMQMDPSATEPTFDVDARMLGLPMLTLDAFISAYAPFDVEAGTLDFVTELAAREGRLEGYMKPIIYHLEVFSWKEDVEQDGDNPLRVAWEALVGFVGELLQNQPRDQLATNIPVSGDISNPETSLLATIGGILRNAFIEAFQADFENSISLFNGDDNKVSDSGTNKGQTE